MLLSHVSLSLWIQSLLTKQIDSPIISIRTKSLKVLQDIYTFSPLPINSPIIDRLSDPSASVRDVALDIVGRSIISHGEQTDILFPKVCERIMDTSVSVRKRSIRLLKDVLLKSMSEEIASMVFIHLLSRLDDEETSIVVSIMTVLNSGFCS